MKPSTSPLTSGAGSYCTGTIVTSEVVRPFAARNAVNKAVLESWTPIFLPLRSATVAMLPPDFRERTVKGFFW